MPKLKTLTLLMYLDVHKGSTKAYPEMKWMREMTKERPNLVFTKVEVSKRKKKKWGRWELEKYQHIFMNGRNHATPLPWNPPGWGISG